jgi:predicted phage tail protein
MTWIAGSGGGKGGGGGATPVDAPDTLRSSATATVLDLVSEGEIEGLVDGYRSIYLDETPLQNIDGTFNFQDVRVDVRNGTAGQQYIQLINGVEQEFSVGTEVVKATPINRTINNTSIDAIRATIGIPALSSTDVSNGNTSGTSVQYKVTLTNGIGVATDLFLGRETKSFTGGFTGANTIGFLCAIQWTPNYPRGIDGYTTPAIATFQIQYRIVGGSWQVAREITVEASYDYTQGSGEVFEWPVSIVVGDTEFSGLSANSYELRVVCTSTNEAVHGVSSLINTYSVHPSTTITITGKTSSRYQRSHLIRLRNVSGGLIYGAGPWTLRVTRITDDSGAQTLQNKTVWDSYTEIIDDKFTYPYSAIVGLQISAKQFSSVPKRAYRVRGLKIKVPVNYDPIARTYTGGWDGTFKVAWSNNPAWIFYDMATNSRYGVGDYINSSLVDKWGLYEIAQYCDQLVPDGRGGMEPRYTCNLYLQSREDAYTVLQNLASVFRGMIYWSSGAIVASADRPQSVDYLFNASNVVDGLFTYSGSSQKTRYNVAMVGWADLSEMGRQKFEYVSDDAAIARHGYINQTELTAFGCTSRGQARRVGQWILYTSRYETEAISFKVGLDGQIPRPGGLIYVSDPNKAGKRMGGRIYGATSNTVTIDSAVDIEAGKTYTLAVINADGAMESRTVTTGAGNVSTLAVSTAWSVTPAPDSIWLLSEPNLNPEIYRVISISEDETGSVFTINALLSYQSKFSFIEQNVPLSIPNTSNLPDPYRAPPAPTNLVATDTVYASRSTILTKLVASWTEPPAKWAVRGYVLRYRASLNDSWTELPEQAATSAEIPNVVDGTQYYLDIRTVNSFGIISTTPATLNYTVIGKARPPSNVTSLSATVDRSQGVLLSWQPVQDVDIDVYEIRRGGTVLQQVKGTFANVNFGVTGNVTYQVYALDTTGNYSTLPATVTVTVQAPATPTVNGGFIGDSFTLSWPAVPITSFDVVEYEVRYGNTWEIATPVIKTKSTGYQSKASWNGNRTFLVRAIDVAGNISAANGATSIEVVPPAAVSIKTQVVDNNVLLDWTDASQTLPIDYYELRKGATYAGGTLIGRINGRFSTVFEAAGGNYSYWIVGVDSAGNQSNPAGVTAQVSQPPDYVLISNNNSAMNGTLSNAVKENTGIILPVNASETWADHFTSRSWASPQDQINAGYPIYIQPALASGFYEETIDYGSVINASKITVTADTEEISGATSASATISVKLLAGDAWIDYAGTNSIYVSNFRYVKIRYAVTSSSGLGIVRIKGINIKLDVKQKTDGGMGTASASDIGGTNVNFGVSFVDVQSIGVTPQGTAASYAVYDFADVPNPTGFKVLLFNSSGARISGPFSWIAKGV